MFFISTNLLESLNCEKMRAPDVCPFPLARLKPGTILASLKEEARYKGYLRWHRGISHGTDIILAY